MRRPEMRPSRQQFADKLVGFRKDPRVFHAQTDQVIDIEKAAIVDFLARHPPERQPVHLRLQQVMKSVEALAVTRRSIQHPQGLCNRTPNRAGILGKFLQALQQRRNLALAACNSL